MMKSHFTIIFSRVKQHHGAEHIGFDKVLGLKLNKKTKVKKVEIPENIKMLVTERDIARANKDFAKSDELRKEIESLGFEVKDTAEGTVVNPV